MLQKEYFGFNSINNLSKILSKHSPNNIFLVTGKSSYLKSGAKKIIDILLKSYKVIHFNNFETNPKITDIKKELGFLNRKNVILLSLLVVVVLLTLQNQLIFLVLIQIIQ